MKTLVALCWGAVEFRSSLTRSYDDSRAEAYDWGREFAHRITRRRYEL